MLDIPRAEELGLVASRIPTTTLTPAAGERLEAAAVWGGPYTASTGESVTLYLSDTYPKEPATAQRWVEFLASLVHGPELSTINAYVLPLREVQTYCGRQALACYSPGRSMLVTPGENPAADVSAEGIIAHEYGHHVAAARDNAPWLALDYGTKRWASYLQMCSRAARGEVFPGDERGNYRLNPGEGFAESYRVLNERRLGLLESRWSIVSTLFQPDATALALLEQDVLQPWTATTTAPRAFSGKRNRAYTIATPLDGTMAVRVGSVGKKTRYRVDVLAAGRRLAQRTTSAGGSSATPVRLCGERSVQIRLTRTAGTGGFTLSVSTP